MNHVLRTIRRISTRLATGKSVGALCLMSVLLLTSCETIIDIDYPEQPARITVNSIFLPGYNFEVHLSEARGLKRNDRDLANITNGEVDLYRNGAYVERLPHVGGGLYRSPSTMPESGDTLEVRVSAPDHEPATATDAVPDRVPVEFDFDAGQSNRSKELELTIRLHDPPQEVNFYRLTAFYQFDGPNGLSMSLSGFHTDDDVIVAENVDPFEDGNDDLNFLEAAFFTDELLDEGVHDIRIKIKAPEGIAGWFASVDVRLDVISRSFYDYATTYRKFETFRDNPFKEPVLVTNNVENGFGLFAGFCSERFAVEF